MVQSLGMRGVSLLSRSSKVHKTTSEGLLLIYQDTKEDQAIKAHNQLTTLKLNNDLSMEQSGLLNI